MTDPVGPLKVTVITYVYISQVNGRLPLFEECLASVQAQGYENYEHVIIDDGSDMDLAPVVAQFPKTRLVRKPGTGIVSSSYTFNLGQHVATGDCCILLPSDDLSVPGGIAALVAALQENPSAKSAIGRAVYENPEKGDLIWTPEPEKIERGIYEKNHINGCAIMWRRTPDVMANLSPNYVGFCADYDLFGLVATSGPVAYVNEMIVRYRWAEDSTRNKTRSRSIISPRKEDMMFYQYSKIARIEFVQVRLRRVPRDFSEFREGKDISGDFALSGKDEAKLTILIGKRSWADAVALLRDKQPDFEAAYRLVSEAITQRMVCRIRHLTPASVALMQAFRLDGVFDLVWDGDFEHAIFEFCPMPAVRYILSKTDARRHDAEMFMGLAA